MQQTSLLISLSLLFACRSADDTTDLADRINTLETTVAAQEALLSTQQEAITVLSEALQEATD